ncbi:N-acetyltransferase [Paenibacillus albiflavus]|uniref:N-acetyltransferase n=2 Tax=Paenibacillus albiflavus TaxID=2545760 RepID=A0A4R4EKR2_9BACL|nr:N-acetyltransferase [Paenibacillus albiflavus]
MSQMPEPFIAQELETGRMIIRKINQGDLHDMFDYCSDSRMTQYVTWQTHTNLEETLSFIQLVENLYLNGEVAPLGIEDKQTGKLIGTCGFVNWNMNHARAEVGYAIASPYWGRGYMTEAVQALIQFGFDRQLVRIEARCHPDNIGSSRVMEKCGMTYEGILHKHLFAKGKYEDVKMYAVINEELLK